MIGADTNDAFIGVFHPFVHHLDFVVRTEQHMLLRLLLLHLRIEYPFIPKKRKERTTGAVRLTNGNTVCICARLLGLCRGSCTPHLRLQLTPNALILHPPASPSSAVMLTQTCMVAV